MILSPSWKNWSLGAEITWRLIYSHIWLSMQAFCEGLGSFPCGPLHLASPCCLPMSANLGFYLGGWLSQSGGRHSIGNHTAIQVATLYGSEQSHACSGSKGGEMDFISDERVEDSGSTYWHLWRIQSATVICILFQVNVSSIFICISEELVVIFFIFVNCCFVFGCAQLCILYFVWLKIFPFSFSKYYQRFV